MTLKVRSIILFFNRTHCSILLTRVEYDRDILTYPILSVVLIAGLPLDQKVVQYGPFVMNTEAEVQQALMDFRTYSNGFERARGWQSEIGKDSM
jgi:hypothetical protein